MLTGIDHLEGETVSVIVDDISRVKLHEPTFGEDEIAAVVDVLRSTRVTSGAKVREMERHFGSHAVMCNSGSSANLLAVAALRNPVTDQRLRQGDEVVVSALSWATTVWPLVQHGLIPVIVDIDPETLNIDPAQVGAAIGPNTRAIMPVHVYGNPCDMASIRAIADERNLWMIEDCCEALGSEYDPETVGDFRTYSFYFSHHITTLEGGMVVAANAEHAELMRILRAHGWTRDLEKPSIHHERHPDIDPRFLFVNAGYNLRASEIAAAMGLVQMGKLPGFVKTRRDIASRLANVVGYYPEHLAVQRETRAGASSWFGFPIIVREAAPFDAAALREYLERHSIETRSLICGNIARQPGMQLWPHRVAGDLKHADHVMHSGFSIGCHQGMTPESVDHVAAVLDEFMKPFL